MNPEPIFYCYARYKNEDSFFDLEEKIESASSFLDAAQKAFGHRVDEEQQYLVVCIEPSYSGACLFEWESNPRLVPAGVSAI